MRIFNTMRADDTVHCMAVFIYISFLRPITYDFFKKENIFNYLKLFNEYVA